MIARHPPARSLAALLAFMAVAVMFALSSLHAAEIHVDQPTQLVALIDTHPDGHDDDHDADAAMHAVAHMVGHSLAIPADAANVLTASFSRHVWTRWSGVVRPGLEPPSLLRPPRN